MIAVFFLPNSFGPTSHSILTLCLKTPHLRIRPDDSVIKQTNMPVTQLMFAQTGIPLGRVVLKGRVSYSHITAVGDWEGTDGFVARV